jgi:tetratricopeptide (TPR) repeat protein
VDSYDSIKRFCRKNLFQPAGYTVFKAVLFILTVLIAVGMTKTIKKSYAEGFCRLTEDNKIEIFSKFMKLEPSAYPQKMAKFLRNAELPDRMFNNFSAGSFLIYNFSPERKVFIDGRTELYGKTFFNEYLLAYNGDEGFFDKIFREYNLQGLIFGYTREEEPAGIIRVAYERGFRCVYFARDGIIFVSDDFLSNNKQLHPFAIDFKDYPLPRIGEAKDLKLASFSSKGLYNQAAVFYLLGFYDKARHILNEIIEVYPNNHKAYYLLARIFYNERDYEKAFLNCRKSLIFNFKFIKAKRLLAKMYIETGSPQDALELIKDSGITVQDLKEICHGL